MNTPSVSANVIALGYEQDQRSPESARKARYEKAKIELYQHAIHLESQIASGDMR